MSNTNFAAFSKRHKVVMFSPAIFCRIFLNKFFDSVILLVIECFLLAQARKFFNSLPMTANLILHPHLVADHTGDTSGAAHTSKVEL